MVPENSSMAPEKLTSLKLFIDYSAGYRENQDQLHVLVTLAAISIDVAKSGAPDYKPAIQLKTSSWRPT